MGSASPTPTSQTRAPGGGPAVPYPHHCRFQACRAGPLTEPLSPEKSKFLPKPAAQIVLASPPSPDTNSEHLPCPAVTET